MSVITRIVLWVWVVAAGIILGGAIYETVVLLPLWAGSAPDSVKAWQHGMPQVRFFGLVTPFYGICSLILFMTSFWMPRRLKTPALLAGVAGTAVVVWTFLFFVPILQQTQATGGAGLPSDEINRLVDQFVSWNYIRAGLIVIGWLAGLRAFSLMSSVNVEPAEF